MQQLYLSVALPKITYGINTWYSPPSKLTGYTKNTRLVRALCNLQKSQRIATLAITCTLRSTANDFIDIHTSVLPMELALLKACHNSIICILTLPDSYPLHQIAQKAKHNPPAKHLSPSDSLIK